MLVILTSSNLILFSTAISNITYIYPCAVAFRKFLLDPFYPFPSPVIASSSTEYSVSCAFICKSNSPSSTLISPPSSSMSSASSVAMYLSIPLANSKIISFVLQYYYIVTDATGDVPNVLMLRVLVLLTDTATGNSNNGVSYIF